MGFIFVNPNPDGFFNGDCVIRAISVALNKPWDDHDKEATRAELIQRIRELDEQH